MTRSKDNWPELCKLANADDGLPTRRANSGSFDKLFWWNRYLGIVSNALVDRGKWPHKITYLDLFAGPGILAKDGERFPGSPMLAAHTPRPFHQLIFCELDPELADSLTTRLSRWQSADRAAVLCGDCNEVIQDVVRLIPSRSLVLAFVDPTGLHASFATLKTLTSGRDVDLLILVPTEMNVHRNLEDHHLPKEWSDLDDVLGGDSDWRTVYGSILNQSRTNVCRAIVEVYKDQLRRHLSYEFFADEVIRIPPRGTPIYRVLFASRHQTGLKFWTESTARTRQGKLLF